MLNLGQAPRFTFRLAPKIHACIKIASDDHGTRKLPQSFGGSMFPLEAGPTGGLLRTLDFKHSCKGEDMTELLSSLTMRPGNSA
jgi:hypothetical protein